MTKFYEKFESNSKDLSAGVNFDADMSKPADGKLLKAKIGGATSSDKDNFPELEIQDDDKKPAKKVTEKPAEGGMAGGAAAITKDDWIKSTSDSADARTRTVTFKDGNVGVYTDGVLTERTRAGGGKDIYRWENGTMIAMERADGRTLKWMGSGYELIDRNGKSLGPSEFTVQTDSNEAYKVQNRKVNASELADPSRKSSIDAHNEEETDVISIETAEPSKANSLELLKAIELKDQDKANKLIQEFKAQNMSDESIADAYQAYTGRSLKKDMNTRFGADYVEASPEAVQEGVNRYERIFKQIDTDGNGIISNKETIDAMADENFKGDDARLVAGFRDAYNNSQGLLINSSMNSDDLKNFKNGRSAEIMLPDFDIIDKDKNGILTKDEIIDDAAKRHNDDARTHIGLLEMITKNNGLTKNELIALSANRANSISNAIYSNNSGNVSDSLYGKLSPDDSIRPENFGQGKVNDCPVISTLSSMSNTPGGREQIRNMITDNGNGTYTVVFPGAPDEKFIVKKPTAAEQMTYANSTNADSGYWANVIEKAYGQYANKSVARRTLPTLLPNEQENEAAGIGVLPFFGGDAGVINLMTGRKAESNYVDISSDRELETILSEAQKNGTPVIAGRAPRYDDKDMPTRHMYCVTGYDPVTKTVTMRNPWNAAGKFRGEFKISLTEFRSSFETIAYNKD